MNRTEMLKKTAAVLLAFTVVAYVLFFVYMAAGERVSVHRTESPAGYTTFQGMEQELVHEASAPAGVRKVFRGTLPAQLPPGSVLCFNIAHHEIQVFLEDTLVYSLSGAETNRIGRNVSSNWCSVSVTSSQGEIPVTVVLTPMFQAAVDKTPVFLLGSFSAIALELIAGELPLMILCSVCVLLGLLVLTACLYFRFVLHSEPRGIAYLGLFSSTIGLWRLTDLRCVSLLLPTHSMALGYISVGALFLCALSLLLYLSTLFEDRKRGLMLLLGCAGSLVCLTVLIQQVLGFTEIRQNLVISHALLIVSVVSVPLIALLNRIFLKSWGLQRSWKLLLLLAVGIGLDLLLYYRNNGNGLMSFSIMGFIVYTIIVFLSSLQDSTRRAYTDSRTGLVNRTRWNQLMEQNIPLPEPYAILVLDLNGLKRVNDSLGHEAGDQLIFQFSCLLRNTLPRTSVICRWGGDEFAVILPSLNRKQLDQQVSQLRSAAEAHSRENPDLPIHFAVGAALSAEHPGISRTDLFRLADENMYQDKQRWYTQKAQRH